MTENRDSIMVIKRREDGHLFQVLPDGREVPWTPPVLDAAALAMLDARSDEELTRAAEADPDNPPITDEDLASGRLSFQSPTLSAADIRAIREGLDLSQAEFARTFGFSLSTYRDWEYGRRTPRGPSAVLLRVIAADPEAVRRVIDAA